MRWAGIVGVLRERGYAVLYRRRFVPTERGRMVTAFLETWFARWVAEGFTTRMEADLDRVAGGEAAGEAVLGAFWGDFAEALESAGGLKREEVRALLALPRTVVTHPETGKAGLTLDVDAGQRHRTDLSMTLVAAGMRGDLLTPSLVLGVRDDGGDAGTGAGLELGAGLGFSDPSRGLDMAARVYGLAAHAEDRHREWGVSGSLKLVPGGSGRGLSMSLRPSYGVDRGDAQRLWTMPDAHALAASDGEAAPPSSRLDTELGYGLTVFGGGFTGTPNVGFGMSDGGARDWRLGWRLTPAASGDTGFEVSLDATRREAANDDAEHGVMLRSLMHW